MIREYVAYGLVVGLLLAIAAYAADGLARLVRLPTRWIWAGALALTLALTALAPRGDDRLAFVVPAGMVATPTGAAVASAVSFAERAYASLRSAESFAVLGLERGIAAAERAVPARFDGWLLAGWMTLTGAMLALWCAVYARYGRARAGWPVADLEGARIRVAPAAGPVVLGLVRPEIIVPRWLLDRDPAEQRLVLAHEMEHVAARDPLVLAAGCVAASLLVWHPAAWWMLSRLRLAVEMDCDRRVLRHGVAPRSYGALLIELAGCHRGIAIGMPALTDGPSHLERRLLAMTTRRSRFARIRGGALAALTLLTVAAACEARLPTSAEIDRMDVASAEKAATRVKLVESTAPVYFVDDVRVSADAAHAIPADRIASIQVRKGTGAPSEILISTHPKGAEAGGVRMKLSIDTMSTKRVRFAPRGAGDLVRSDRFTGLLLIDGVRSEMSAMRALAPGAIDKVEVLKGEAATRAYADPAAANGVILIATRKAGIAK